jgi:hypothetical protein
MADMPANPCRCGHEAAKHWSHWIQGLASYCTFCSCPEYRVLETPDTLTLRGTQTPANAAEAN